MNFISNNEHVVNKVLRLGAAFGRPASLPKPQTVVLDYSSVNIGKPIHSGHLRATMIGHFVRRINEFMGHNVIGINYLGDWGSQFSFLIDGFQRYGSYKELKENRSQHLFQVYLRACTEQRNSTVRSPRIDSYTRRMDSGDGKLLRLWETFRMVSVEDLMETYERMNIDFTEYQFESQFVNDAKRLVKDMQEQGLAWNEDGVMLCKGHLDQNVTLLTNKGWTLYITRDLAAALQRRVKFQFDRMHYIVGEGQTVHFKNLEHILRNLGCDWIDQCQPWGLHIRFGNVMAISTRHGRAIFLRDILDKARDGMLERLVGNTRLADEEEMRAVAEKLGWSFLLEAIFRFSRLKPVAPNFDDKQLGVQNQYCNVRLCSIAAAAREKGLEPLWDEEQMKQQMADDVLAEHLAVHLLRMEPAIQAAYTQLEPVIVFNYMERLRRSINKYIYSRPVITCEDVSLAQGRLALLMAGQQALHNCFHLLGISPVDRM